MGGGVIFNFILEKLVKKSMWGGGVPIFSNKKSKCGDGGLEMTSFPTPIPC